ncbi:hypothetical protein FIBSPDRAFT_888835 [Athelia psychrophila]|uniref:Uncharacterized protein n=1 Tax=Athelia psychrophila TaxID=1759441 RepID=A0A166MVV0_9AGAM|nr:hypothetical protein FIBSPDRAFT_888835 [Fibularhizoctonia sp. CBS 109695]
MYTSRDTNAVFADDVVKLDDISWFMSPERIVNIAKSRYPAQNTKHPHAPRLRFSRRGFCTHLPSFLPKLQMAACARHCACALPQLAVSNGVPVAPGTRVTSAAHVRAFVKDRVRYPAMIKAAGRWERAQDKRCQRRGKWQGGVQTVHGREPPRPAVFRDGALWTGMKAYRGLDRRRCHWRRSPPAWTTVQRRTVAPEGH